MKLGILMDPPETLKPEKDSTIAMIESAQQMGWFCVYFTLNDIFCLKGIPYARMHQITIHSLKDKQWSTIKPFGEHPLSTLNIILMRKDPPFDMEYIYATYALDLAEQEGVKIINKPQSLRDTNEKFYTFHFPQCCPLTLVSRDMKRLRAFWEEHQQVIFKPLYGMGGLLVYYVDEQGQNLSVILETLTQGERVSIMAQRYIPEIKLKGDKRILLINGNPIEFALARIPAPGELRGNLAAGATGKVVPITERDRWICNELSPTLRAKGLYFVGIDVIGDYLTEINVTSPTCIREINRETGFDIAGDLLRSLASENGI